MFNRDYHLDTKRMSKGELGLLIKNIREQRDTLNWRNFHLYRSAREFIVTHSERYPDFDIYVENSERLFGEVANEDLKSIARGGNQRAAGYLAWFCEIEKSCALKFYQSIWPRFKSKFSEFQFEGGNLMPSRKIDETLHEKTLLITENKTISINKNRLLDFPIIKEAGYQNNKPLHGAFLYFNIHRKFGHVILSKLAFEHLNISPPALSRLLNGKIRSKTLVKNIAMSLFSDTYIDQKYNDIENDFLRSYEYLEAVQNSRIDLNPASSPKLAKFFLISVGVFEKI